MIGIKENLIFSIHEQIRNKFIGLLKLASKTIDRTSISDLKVSKFIQKRLQNRCFPVKFAKFLSTPILKNIYGQLLLQFTLFTLNSV